MFLNVSNPETDVSVPFIDDRGAATVSCWAPEGWPLACRPKDAPTPGDNTGRTAGVDGLLALLTASRALC
jgi:hypothetical protein